MLSLILLCLAFAFSVVAAAGWSLGPVNAGWLAFALYVLSLLVGRF